MSNSDIEALVAAVQDDYLRKDYASAGILRKLEWRNDGCVVISLVFPYPTRGLEDGIRARLVDLLREQGIDQLEINIKSLIRAHASFPIGQSIDSVSNVIAIMSGKGGVGKSTVTVLTALALSAAGARVGILDADIHGPNVGKLLGIDGKVDREHVPLKPIMHHGIATQSMAYLVDDHAPIIWRGPMASRALKELLHKTAWPKLDYLLVDMPPGTSDIALTVSKNLPVTGYLLVSTAQAASVLDVMRVAAMLEKLDLPILGLVENMQNQACPECGHQMALFPGDGVAELAKRCRQPVLATWPFDPSVQLDAVAGQDRLSLESITEPMQAQAMQLARQLVARVALLPLDYQRRFGKITVENNQQGENNVD